jgi:phage tail sheath gpL-like
VPRSATHQSSASSRPPGRLRARMLGLAAAAAASTVLGLAFADAPAAYAATGTLTLSGTVAQATTVSLENFAPGLINVPATVTVPAGASSTTFTGTTRIVTIATNVTITAVSGGVTETIAVIVTPRPGATGSDTVTIKTAKWDKGIENIEATSTNHNATLFIGDTPGQQQTLTNEGGGTYKLQFDEVNQPTSVSVFSTFGGAATAAITQ